MALSSRLSGPILSDVSSATLFAGVDEQERMKALRSKITDVRRMWQNNDEYEALKMKIREYTDHSKLSTKTISRITTLLSGYSDWVDMNYHRPEEQRQSFTAIEIYCSEEGYNFLFGIFNAALREKDTDDNVLLVAAALVEFVTIELYNLRLSNIGDPKYENFQGVTFRGMTVSKAMAAAYRKAASNPDLSKRHFGVPLGFTSSSTNEATISDFAKRYPGQDQMHWVIHIQGLDPRLLRKYEQRYPDSVVTSITAMPVGRLAELREQEILLRGAFFHIVRMESKEIDGVTIHQLELVMMNTNRDHGTELALDEGAKAAQRIFFRDMIIASRFEKCAQLARSFSVSDSVEYERLAKSALDRISASEFMAHGFSIEFPHAVSEYRATWYGDKLGTSFSGNYLELRRGFHEAAQKGQWNVVRDVICGDYEWQVEEWFNVQAVGLPWRGRTLLHEMATLGPPNPNSEHSPGWEYLIQKLKEPRNGIWKSLQTFDTQQTAEQIARARNELSLADLLKPADFAPVKEEWEMHLHHQIRKSLGHGIKAQAFAMPQLSIMSEIKEYPYTLWIPVMGTYGGFLVILGEDMRGISLIIQKLEMRKGEIKHLRESVQLS